MHKPKQMGNKSIQPLNFPTVCAFLSKPIHYFLYSYSIAIWQHSHSHPNIDLGRGGNICFGNETILEFVFFSWQTWNYALNSFLLLLLLEVIYTTKEEGKRKIRNIENNFFVGTGTSKQQQSFNSLFTASPCEGIKVVYIRSMSNV